MNHNKRIKSYSLWFIFSSLFAWICWENNVVIGGGFLLYIAIASASALIGELTKKRRNTRRVTKEYL